MDWRFDYTAEDSGTLQPLRWWSLLCLMQMMHQIPILQLVVDKTADNPVSTEEKSTIKAAILRHTLKDSKVDAAKIYLPGHIGHSHLDLAADNCSQHCLLHHFETGWMTTEQQQ